ncbi:hypothetical protein [Burkholderia aenigmatica]|nr:hypothetical protein [Burkholderia aenigmatica]MDN7875600.1 hypothetical protein [Burkholderia aenigmatica]
MLHGDAPDLDDSERHAIAPDTMQLDARARLRIRIGTHGSVASSPHRSML